MHHRSAQNAQKFLEVPKRAQKSTEVQNVNRSAQKCTTEVLKNAQEFLEVPKRAQKSTEVHKSAQKFTEVHRGEQKCQMCI